MKRDGFSRPWARRAVPTAVALAIGASAVAALAGGGPAPPAEVLRADAPDVVLVNGRISTVDAANTTVEALAVRDGVIIATGRSGPIRALAGTETQVIDLNGRRVVPGLIDGTLHGVRNGYHCFTRAVRNDLTVSRSAALAAYAARGAALPAGTWIFTTSGWNVNQLDVPGMFTKAELDAALPNHPVFVQGRGFTGAQVNSRALQLLGITAATPSPPNGTIVKDPATGEPTGQLTGAATGLARRAIGAQLEGLTIHQQADCLAAFVREANRVGLTAWDDPGGSDPFDAQGRTIEALREGHGFQAVNQLRRDGRLTARIVLQLTSFGGLATVQRDSRHAFSAIGDDVLRIGGIGEEVMGSVAGLYPQPEYTQLVEHLAQNRWKFEHHASLAVTQDQILDTWEQVNATHPIGGLGWFMLHPFEGPTHPSSETLSRLRALGTGVVPTDSNAMGASTQHPPYKRIFESGTRNCLGSDAIDAGPYPPFIHLWYTISGKTLDPATPGVVPDQRLTREQALRAATANCAWFVRLEGKVGSLEAGKYADLVVLSRDYFTVPVDDIRGLTSVLTMVGGKVVFADAEFAALDD